MPIYEYRCLKCGKIFTEIQGIREDPLRVHESCGGELERLISGGRLMMTERKSGNPVDEDFGPMPGGGFGDGFGPGMGDGFGMDGMDEGFGGPPGDEFGGMGMEDFDPGDDVS